jgi:para-nitrobenzyl esterase
MQVKRPPDSFYGPGADDMSEDCLYLNVWTAASADERRPVMVWIHGGGLRNGHGGRAAYDGTNLAKRGVVLVTINYRLGPFGFLAHPLLSTEDEHGSSGNYGMLDQIAALEWVRDNIAGFGGDPERVTIFGESAGSLSVSYLQASPLAAGLFHRAIGESGSALRSSTYLTGDAGAGETAEAAGQRFVVALLDSNEATLEAMRAASAENILATLSKDDVAFPSRANVDGTFLTQEVATAFAAGEQHDVPVIVGWNADEGPALVRDRGPSSVEEVRSWAKSTFGESSDGWHGVYPVATDAEAREQYLRSYGVMSFGWGAREWARLMSTVDSPAYLYLFARVPPGPDSERYGAYHAAEILYVFDNLDQPGVGRSERPWEEADRELADQMASYWVNFAASGDPNGEGLPEWPAYEGMSDVAMVFAEESAAQAQVRKEELDFFDRWQRERADR